MGESGMAMDRIKAFTGAVAGALALVGLMALAAAPAQAVPFSFEYNSTISGTDIPGLIVTDAVKITVTLDNGNATALSQTWTGSDAVSVTFDFANGLHVTTFSAPFDGGMAYTGGNFVTNAAGTLTDVMDSWFDFNAVADFTTTGAATDFGWYLNGFNGVYFENTFGTSVDLTNVSDMWEAANWSLVGATTTAVPAPGALALFGIGLVGLGALRRRYSI